MTMKLNEVDQLIIRYADTMSATQISFKLEGLLSPEQVATRRQTLLDVPDALTAAQQDQLVTLKMRQLVVELEEMPRTARNAEVLIRSLEAVGARLDKRAAMTEKDLSTLYAFQGTVLLDAIEVAVERIKAMISGLVDVNEDTWNKAIESGIQHAQLEIGKHEQEPVDVFEVVKDKEKAA